jgi:hypothetical protein
MKYIFVSQKPFENNTANKATKLISIHTNFYMQNSTTPVVLEFVFLLPVSVTLSGKDHSFPPFPCKRPLHIIFGQEVSESPVQHTVVYEKSCMRVNNEILASARKVLQSSKFSHDTIHNEGKFPSFFERSLMTDFYTGVAV